MKKIKWIIAIFLVLLIGFVLYLYNEFNGNPISQYISKKTLENYLEETYPEREFQVEDGVYNFKFSRYEYTVSEIGSKDDEGNVKQYEFTVNGFINPELGIDGVYNENLDYELSERLSKQAATEIYELLSAEINSIHRVEIYIEVLQGEFDKNAIWTKNFSLKRPMEIFIQLDSTKQSKENFVSESEQIKEILDGEGYEYDSIVFNGSGFDLEGLDEEKNEYLKYSLSVNKDGKVKIGKVEEHNSELW